MDAANTSSVLYLFSTISTRIVWLMAIILMAMAFRVAVTAANLGRNLMEGRLGILTAAFEAAPINT